MPNLLDRLETALADRYAIEHEVGSGGMATVYLAEDLKLHRKVALKVLRPELAAALGPERFLREIEIAAKLHHLIFWRPTTRARPMAFSLPKGGEQNNLSRASLKRRRGA